MKFDLSEIKLSRKDVKRGLKFPSEMSEELAEDIGIMIGDGCILAYNYKSLTHYFISVDGNSLTDKKYLMGYVSNLKSNLYNLNFSSQFKKNRNEMRIQIYSQGLVQFYAKIVGLPLGKKINIGLPSHIWEDEKFIRACLRGIMDTDGCFQLRRCNYPQIKIGTSSKRLVEDCKKAFKLLGIETNIKTDCVQTHCVTKRTFVTNYLYLSGREKFKKYMKLIGFSNPNNINKYSLFKHSKIYPRHYFRKNNGPKGISIQETQVQT